MLVQLLVTQVDTVPSKQLPAAHFKTFVLLLEQLKNREQSPG